MATESSEGEHHENTDAQDASEPLGVDPDAVPLLPPHERSGLPDEHLSSPGRDVPLAPADPLGPDQWPPADPGDYGPPAPGLEFAPPAPGLADDAVDLPAPGLGADVHEMPPPAPPAADASLDEPPPWAVAGPLAASVDASETERAAWPTVDPTPLAETPLAETPHVEPPLEAPMPAALTEPEPLTDVPVFPSAEPAFEPVPAPDPTPEPVSVDDVDLASADEAVAAPHELATPDGSSEADPASNPIARPPEAAASQQDMYDVPLGTLVYRSGLLSAEQIESALAESERIGKRLGEVLVDSQMIDERDLGRLLAGQKGLPFIDLGHMEIDPAATELLPAASARIYCAVPISVENGTPVVAVSDPTNGLVVEGVRRAMGGELSFTVATRSELQRAIASHYGGDATAPSPEPAAAAPAPSMHTNVEPSAHTGEHVTHQPVASSPSEPETTAVEAVTQLDAGSTDLPEEDVAMNQPEGVHTTPLAGAESPVAPTPVSPTPFHVPSDAQTDGETTVHVKVRLSDGDLVEAATFSDFDAAVLHGRQLIQSMSAGDSGEWPFIAGRFLRPAMVVSIDLVQERTRY